MFCSLSWLLYGFSRVTWQSCLEAVWSDNSDLKPSSKTAHRPANVIYNRELRIGNELTSDLQGEKRLSRSLHTLIIKAPNSSLGGYQTLPRRLLFILEQQGKPSSQSRLNCEGRLHYVVRLTWALACVTWLYVGCDISIVAKKRMWGCTHGHLHDLTDHEKSGKPRHGILDRTDPQSPSSPGDSLPDVSKPSADLQKTFLSMY